MTTIRPLALDLFCKAGGASKGLHDAGFDVVGVDWEPQPRYPFTFVQADATRPPFDLGAFAFIWASPPCQKFSINTPAERRAAHPDLIDPIRKLLVQSGRPWVIENVPLAPIRPDLILTGEMFGLPTYRRRHFETNFLILAPPHGPRFGPATKPGSVTLCGGGGRRRDGTVDDWRRAINCPWMNRPELANAIPPAYAEFIGKQALRQITAIAA